nr:hypothetical protein [uncultured Fluviicola sp.]
MNLALVKEINKQYIEAVKCYESEIADNPLISADEYINLAFLYWSFAFELFEFDLPNNIMNDYSVIGGNRYQEILNLGLDKFPNNIELHFWKRYFQHIIYGEDFSENDCKELLEKFGVEETIVPYFFLHQFDKEKYREKISDLLTICNTIPTAKNLYIESIVKN